MDQSYNAYSSWLCRSQTENKSQRDLTWPQLSFQNQMKHTAQKNEQHCRYRSDASISTEIFTQVSLNESEYPELGQKNVKIKSLPDLFVSHHESVITETVIPYVTKKAKHQKLLGLHKHRRSEKLFLDLSKALENAECFINRNRKKSRKLKFDVYKINSSGANTNKSNEKGFQIRKNKLYNIKFKKPSRLKRTIILERWNNMKMKYQDEINTRKIKENVINVNSINLNTLKIKSDPEVDVDYVKLMSTLTVYDRDYRNTIVENISEDSVQFRPDLTQKLDELKISDVKDKNISTAPYRNAFNNTNDLNVLQRNLSLTDEDNVDIKPNINNLLDVKYSKNVREYCNNLITFSLNESLEKFLSEIRRLQTKLYNRDQNKGKYKRRYYSGLKEVQKHVLLKKVQFVVIAPDIEKILSAGGLNEEIDKLLENCKTHETVFCFGLRRRKLGYYAHGNGLVSCIGISNYANAEQFFWNVLVEVIIARNMFEELRGRSEKIIDISKIIQENGLLTENIGVLLKSLASIK
ncbi:selenocysteine insertion sequence-binding protein 2-like isoform X1 [Vespa mandarinia]|uniref:selenocysteine insertion sequence-binding protein 2-like isoform X1 n=1 Tax=Vespa mandarinia TaxID=7446 RepID=UPI001618C27A|nr:selenocysteine insertion sequence-binding protein 2-like isoform X1 [Vespa mandarinia]XP_035728935.1 selenocysteine insertion sequence-binding protein 2-like isoform X1 [Vespa mandarinia]